MKDEKIYELMKYLPQEMVERVKKRGTKASQSPQVQAVADSKAPVSAESGTTASADSGKELSQEEALRFMREDTPKLLASLRMLVLPDARRLKIKIEVALAEVDHEQAVETPETEADGQKR